MMDEMISVATHNGVELTAVDLWEIWSDVTYLPNHRHGWLSDEVTEIGYYKNSPVVRIVDYETFSQLMDEIICDKIKEVSRLLKIDKGSQRSPFWERLIEAIRKATKEIEYNANA